VAEVAAAAEAAEAAPPHGPATPPLPKHSAIVPVRCGVAMLVPEIVL